MYNFQRDVLAYHIRFNCYVGNVKSPQAVNQKFRADFIREEARETALKGLRDGNEIEIVNGLCDTLYVTIGTAIEFGIDLTSEISFEHVPFAYPGSALLDNREYWSNEILMHAEFTAHAIMFSNLSTVRVRLAGLVRVVNRMVTAWGIDIRPFWAEVQRSNMVKIPSGKPDVKSTKPLGWLPPQMGPILARQKGLAA